MPLVGIGTLPTPFSPASVPLPPETGGRGHTGLRVGGWGESQFQRGAYTVVLFICTYFVLFLFSRLQFLAMRPNLPKVRRLAQHGGPPGWLEESDPIRVWFCSWWTVHAACPDGPQPTRILLSWQDWHSREYCSADIHENTAQLTGLTYMRILLSWQGWHTWEYCSPDRIDRHENTAQLTGLSYTRILLSWQYWHTREYCSADRADIHENTAQLTGLSYTRMLLSWQYRFIIDLWT